MERKGKFTNPYWLLKCWCVPSIPAPPPWHSWARSSPQLWSRGTSGGWCWPCASSSAAPLSDTCCSWSSSSVWFGILVDLQESVSKQRSLSDSPNSICDIGLWDFLFGADCQAENWPNICQVSAWGPRVWNLESFTTLHKLWLIFDIVFHCCVNNFWFEHRIWKC